MSDILITKAFSEIEKYLTLNEEDYKNTPALDSEEKDITPEEKNKYIRSLRLTVRTIASQAKDALVQLLQGMITLNILNSIFFALS